MNSLTRLFEPRSIAVVGATESAGKAGSRVMRSLIEHGYGGRILPINPGRPVVHGIKAYPSLEHLDEPADLAILCLGAEDAVAGAEQAVRARTGGLISFAAGFSEKDEQGRQLERRLTDIVTAGGVPLVGPNCLGLMNAHRGLVASSAYLMTQRKLTKGGLSFIGQSGAVGTYWLEGVFEAGFGVSKWVSTGNEASVNAATALEYMVEDEDTDVIAMYLEGVRDGRAFVRGLSRAADARKPVIVLKSGRSAAGAKAAASHTGALAGEDNLIQALLKQYGASSVRSLREMMEVSRMFLSQKPRPARRIAIVSMSGGAGTLSTDAATFDGFDVAEMSSGLRSGLKPLLPDYANPQNPLDLVDALPPAPETFGKALDMIVASGEYDAVMPFFGGDLPAIARPVSADFRRLFRAPALPYTIAWQSDSAERRAMQAEGYAVFEDIPAATNALRVAVEAVRAWDRERPAPAEWVAPASDGVALVEAEGKRIVERLAGLRAPRSTLVQSVVEARAALAGLTLPVVAKIQSRAMLHKTGMGGIALNLRSEAAVAAAVEEMLRTAASRALPLHGILLEEMAQVDLELLVGLRIDPTFGPLLVVGRGGVTVEIDPDLQYRFLPVTAASIGEALMELRCSRLFDAFRGRPAIDVAALAARLERLATAFVRSDALLEIEINPLGVTRAGEPLVLDALVRRRN